MTLEMDDGAIEAEVKKILSEMLDIEIGKILNNLLLKDDLGMDSFDSVEVVFAIEDKFEIKVEEKDIAEITKVEHMIGYVQKKFREKSNKIDA